MIYISMESIGSTDRAPNTASVETGSVAAISDPKMKHSITENSMPSKRWKWKVIANRIANYHLKNTLVIGISLLFQYIPVMIALNRDPRIA